MNSSNDLYSRLLEGFPVNELKAYFGIDGTKEEVVDNIISNESTSNIENFIIDYFGYLHQHILVFELNSRLNNPSDLMSSKRIFRSVNSRNSSWLYLHKTKVTFFNPNTGNDESLEFLIPVKVEVISRKVIVHFNTLARDIRTYFDHNIYPNRFGNLEEEIISDVRNNVGQTLFSLDLNVGIKRLWTIDEIDAISVKNKKSRSIKQERMDQSFTYKKQYPAEWAELMLTPIRKTKFIPLTSQIDVHLFDCDPSIGYIGITNYSNTNNSVKNLVDLILSNN